MVAKGLFPDGRCQPGLSFSPSGMVMLMGRGHHSSTTPFIHLPVAILCLLGAWPLGGYGSQM